MSTGETLADDPISIPLEYVGQTDSNNQVSYDRLGIWAKINNGKAQRYVFDTGSDQLNTQIGKDVTGVNPVSPGLMCMPTAMEPTVTSSSKLKSTGLRMSTRMISQKQ
ncbi:hypothetical protein HED63_22695 [Ochrobactrum cytisi]|nr:hypothetical protein [Brucella cytisi]